MIEIYNEIGHIQQVLEKGLGPKWRQDLILLIKYWKSYPPHYKKDQIKKMALDKCIQYVPLFNPITQKGEINKIVDSTWAKWKYNPKHPENNNQLRDITEVKISQEVLDWFLSLPNEYEIDKEELKRVRKLRQGLTINEHPLNQARVRMLFTLYIWMLIQSNYVDFSCYFKFKKIKQKLKNDAKLSSSFKLKEERDLLKDLGFFRLTQKDTTDIILEFQNKFEVFKTPLAEDNTIIINGDDLYNIGEWFNKKLEEKKIRSKYCADCGKELKINPKKTRGRPNKYCPACAEKHVHEYQSRYCKDCGQEIEFDITTKRRPYRCISCAEKRRKRLAAERNRKYMQKQKEKTNQK